MDKMTVHLFKIFPTQGASAFEIALQQAFAVPIQNRTRQIGIAGLPVRIEALTPPAAGSTLWKMDFARLRDNHGPGKATNTTAVQPIPMAQGEVFAEEAAAIYDSTGRYLAMQFHPMGVRASGVIQYLDLILGNANSYTAAPVLDPTVQAKLANAAIFRKLSFTVAPGQLTQAMKQQNLSLARALEASAVLGPQKVNMDISVGNSRAYNLTATNVRSWLDTLRAWFNEDDSSISKIQVSAKAHDDAPVEVLDLLEQRLRAEFTMQPGPGLRVPRNDRWLRIEAAYNHWRTII